MTPKHQEISMPKSDSIERPSYDPAVKMTFIKLIKQAVAEIRYDYRFSN